MPDCSLTTRTAIFLTVWSDPDFVRNQALRFATKLMLATLIFSCVMNRASILRTTGNALR